jgi:hypothetical protein
MAKRHAVGRQLSDEEQARIWEVVFSCGRDYFNSLRELGLDCHERPVDRELAKEAWGRLRTAYYKLRATRWEPIGGETPWAGREFGNPLGGIGRARVK